MEDVCTGILYDDDSRITRVIGNKIWAVEGYTEFKVSVLDGKE